MRPHHLRQLVRFFLDAEKEFPVWLAGYFKIAQRIGWRPSEILNMRCEARVLSAPAKKRTNERGLADRLEIMIGARYPEQYVDQLRAWIAETPRWIDEYEGRESLLAAMREQIRRACVKLRIKPICPYTLRHFTISCLKKSGWRREEIAVVVNHATNRTATEKYGKAKNGIKRPRRIFHVDPARVALVRKTAREFKPRPDQNHRP